MSGHSKWANIKHRKEATDKKRAQVFSKLLKAIAIVARDDNNPESNPTLRTAIERAHKYNVPNENIQRALKKSQESSSLEQILLEAYGPEGSAILIEATTDNRNRTIPEIKKILKDHNAKWAEPGSVLWAFEKNEEGYHPKFPQTLSPKSEEVLLALFEDLDDHDDVVELFTSAALSE